MTRAMWSWPSGQDTRQPDKQIGQLQGDDSAAGKVRDVPFFVVGSGERYAITPHTTSRSESPLRVDPGPALLVQATGDGFDQEVGGNLRRPRYGLDKVLASLEPVEVMPAIPASMAQGADAEIAVCPVSCSTMMLAAAATPASRRYA